MPVDIWKTGNVQKKEHGDEGKKRGRSPDQTHRGAKIAPAALLRNQQQLQNREASLRRIGSEREKREEVAPVLLQAQPGAALRDSG